MVVCRLVVVVLGGFSVVILVVMTVVIGRLVVAVVRLVVTVVRGGSTVVLLVVAVVMGRFEVVIRRVGAVVLRVLAVVLLVVTTLEMTGRLVVEDLGGWRVVMVVMAVETRLVVDGRGVVLVRGRVAVEMIVPRVVVLRVEVVGRRVLDDVRFLVTVVITGAVGVGGLVDVLVGSVVILVLRRRLLVDARRVVEGRAVDFTVVFVGRRVLVGCGLSLVGVAGQ